MTKKQLSQRALIAVGLVLSLAACGGGGGGGTDTVVDPPKVVVTNQEDQFGTAFGTDFRTAANTDPAPPVNDGDIVPVSLTTEPVNITP
jgi:hypothetical protein